MGDAQNSKGSAPPKPPGRPFEKGKSGNPGGRPKGIVAKVKRLVGEDGGKALEILWRIAQDGTAKDSDRIAAVESLLNRGFGKPAQPIDGDGNGGPIIVELVKVSQ